MGYRLGIYVKEDYDKITNKYYGTKYYGYEDLEESLSYKFLQCINKFDGNEWFDYGEYNDIALNKKEFELFCKLYDLDFKTLRRRIFIYR
jgi:hypothetical protein